MTKKENMASPQVIPPSIETVGLVVKNIFTPKEMNVGTIVGTQLLAGVEVRIVEYDGDFFIPETDVAEGLDQDRGNFFNLLERNKELLNNYPCIVMVTIQGQRRKTRLLSFENTRRAIMLVDHNVKDSIRRNFLIERKRQYFQIIDMVCAGKSASSPVLLALIVQDRIDTCKMIAAAVGCDLTAVLTTELAQVEEQTGQKIGYLNQLPLQNPVRKAAVFTETELGKHFNVSGRMIQKILKEKGYLRSIGGRIDFTHIGLLYGDWRPGIEFKGKMRTMARMRRFWNQDIVPKLDEHFYYLQKAKEGLFTGELGVIS